MAMIILYASNVIGQSMAGPAIRSWEFAKELSREHSVVLVAPNQPTIKADEFLLISSQDPKLKAIFKQADVLIAQTLPFKIACLAKYYGIKIILDAYDPVPLELLELFKSHPLKFRQERNKQAVLRLNFEFQMADSIICASEKQRDLWMGLLLAHQKLTPTAYTKDSSLRQLIDVVPFGLSDIPPQKTGPGLKEQFHFKASDKIILWGGGIWNWFDPLSLIRAVKRLSVSRSDIKLVFMGIKNPDNKVPEMKMCQDSIQLAKDLGLLDRFVFFNYGWVPYQDRQNSLLDANIGASTHFDHLETRYSFRTRMLDYLWAKLPILATEGDSFADLIAKENLGIIVPYQNEQALADAIVELVDRTDKIQMIKENLARVQSQFFWKTALAPLKAMIHHLTPQQSGLTYHTLKEASLFAARYTSVKVQEKGIQACFKKLLKTG